LSSLADDDAGRGFVSLFNGRDLAGWKGDKSIWSVRNGAITGRTTPDTKLKVNNFLIWQGGQPADFELRLKYRLRGGNSGIYFHAEPQPEGDPLVGPQADFSADHRWTGVLMEWKKRDVLAERGQKVVLDPDGTKRVVGSVGDPQTLLEAVHDEDWNDYTVVTRGGHTVLKINGTTMCEVHDHDPRRTPRGHLALQVHVGPPMQVQFKDIRLRHYCSAAHSHRQEIPPACPVGLAPWQRGFAVVRNVRSTGWAGGTSRSKTDLNRRRQGW
jgi:hypothetical protein